MADILVKDRPGFEDALVDMIRCSDSWENIWSIIMYVRRPPLNRQVKHKDYFDLLMIA